MPRGVNVGAEMAEGCVTACRDHRLGQRAADDMEG